MAFWSKKNSNDILIKYLNDNNISYTKCDNEIEIQINFDNSFCLFLYVKVSDNLLSLTTNIKQTDNIALLNNFNINSPFFKAIYSNDFIIYLEYNTIISPDTLIDSFKIAVDSLNNLQDEILKL